MSQVGLSMSRMSVKSAARGEGSFVHLPTYESGDESGDDPEGDDASTEPMGFRTNPTLLYRALGRLMQEHRPDTVNDFADEAGRSARIKDVWQLVHLQALVQHNQHQAIMAQLHSQGADMANLGEMIVALSRHIAEMEQSSSGIRRGITPKKKKGEGGTGGGTPQGRTTRLSLSPCDTRKVGELLQNRLRFEPLLLISLAREVNMDNTPKAYYPSNSKKILLFLQVLSVMPMDKKEPEGETIVDPVEVELLSDRNCEDLFDSLKSSQAGADLNKLYSLARTSLQAKLFEAITSALAAEDKLPESTIERLTTNFSKPANQKILGPPQAFSPSRTLIAKSPYSPLPSAPHT